jgi:hypothetical protein
MDGSEAGALVVRVICGTDAVEVESGSAVPEVTPAVGMVPPVHAYPESGNFVPEISVGSVKVGRAK